MNLQLRRYRIEPGRMDDFLAWWQGIVPIREKYGYAVVFALADRDNDEFVWAVTHDEDFAIVDPRYEQAPERAAHQATNPQVVLETTVTRPHVVKGGVVPDGAA